MTHSISGQCLCGSVKLSASVEKKEFDACHCSMCRRWSGGPLMTVHALNPQWQGETINSYHSSDWGARGYCTQCGTNLYYLFKRDHAYYVPLGLIDDAADFTFKTEIFVDSKPSNYEFANETEQLTEAEVFAKFS
jgi:hypothetical protein